MEDSLKYTDQQPVVEHTPAKAEQSGRSLIFSTIYNNKYLLAAAFVASVVAYTAGEYAIEAIRHAPEY